VYNRFNVLRKICTFLRTSVRQTRSILKSHLQYTAKNRLVKRFAEAVLPTPKTVKIDEQIHTVAPTLQNVFVFYSQFAF